MDVLILADSVHRIDWNQADFANCFLDKGMNVFYGLINSLSTRNYIVYGDTVQVLSKVHHYGSVPDPVKNQCIEGYDLIWVMNQPHPALAKDIWQILWMLSKRVPFVNSVEAMVFLNNKNNLGLIVPQHHLVENYAANEYGMLWDIYTSRKEQRWVAKPTNAGCGADVYILQPGDTNAQVILQSMTGNVTTSTEINNANIIGLQNKYCILQEYIPQVAEGEKRVIIAGGAVIAQHGRRLALEDHRSNLTHGGKLIRADLTPKEMQLCSHIASTLFQYGVNFIGIDMSYPYILEFNIINPGGVYDILEVTGIDYNDIIISRILSAIHNRQSNKGNI